MYIDTQQDLDNLIAFLAGKVYYAIPLVDNSKKHFVNTSLLSLYIKCEDSEFIIPYKHQESLLQDIDVSTLLNLGMCYFYDRQLLRYLGYDVSKVRDMELVHYLNTCEAPSKTYIDTEQFYNRLLNKYTKPNTLVSTAIFVKYAREIVESMVLTPPAGLDYYTTLQDTFFEVERQGIQVETSLFRALYGSPINLIDSTVYTKYHFFTTTGRPSNRFAGINFAALNKGDDTRKCFISRFPGGKLIELDFKAYHPHIIAHLCDYDFGDENIYAHLAKHYFQTDNPTPEEITQAKEYTFNQIYGGINKKYLHIEFFAKVKAFTDLLWEEYQQKGYITSNISGRQFKVTDTDTLSSTRLFNYFIQMTETELNGLYLQRLLPSIDNTKALPILYIYDAVVFDCKKDYVDELVGEIIRNTSRKFPVTVKVGDNYKEMINYNYEATTSMHVYG